MRYLEIVEPAALHESAGETEVYLMSDEELGDIEIQTYGGNGQPLEKMKLKDCPLSHLQATYAFAHGKRKPEIKRLKLLVSAWLQRLHEQEEKARQKRNSLDRKAPFQWHDKTVVWTDGDTYAVVVDYPKNATYVSVWTKDNKRIGFLSTRGSHLTDYLGIGTADLQAKHRGKGLGKRMYQMLLQHLGPQWKGIATYLPDQANKKQVPKIYKRLGAYHPGGDLDYLVVDRP